MKTPQCAIVDFETTSIEKRPQYPPIPVGVSITLPRRKQGKYYAWGHPTENNCSKQAAVTALREPWDNKNVPILYHNSKFDCDVAETRMALKPLPWQRVHDTLYLLFLHDPHERNISLKPSAERLLKLPPEEQDAVRQWVLDNVKGASKGNWGAHISKAPAKLVGRYANGDCERTGGLFNFLYQDIADRGMLPAYNRERELMPILLDNERRGIRVDLPLLRKDIKLHSAALAKCDEFLRARLKKPNLNVDSDDEWAAAIEERGIIRDEDWKLTATGKKSVSKVNLTLDMYADKQVASIYGHRNRLATCIRMFMVPWYEEANGNLDGTIHTTWNQVRQSQGESGIGGTRSGRPSTKEPNFLNLAKSFEDRGDGYVYPMSLPALARYFKDSPIPPLPLVRGYLLPDKGDVWVHRDWNQQELRLLAHFEGGDLLQAYLKDPGYSVHKTMHTGLERILMRDFYYSYVKNFDFQVIYGGGIPAVANALHCEMTEAKKAIGAIRELLPGYDALKKEIKATAAKGEPIVTWGGREYYTEKPAYSKKHKRHMTFEYKLLSYLIQGSAADVFKEVMIRWMNHPKREARFLVGVYDEVNMSAAKGDWRRQNDILNECMSSVELDLPLLSEGKMGASWGKLKKF